MVAASPDVEIYGNEVINNADGIAGIQQNRSDAPSSYGPQIVANLYVHDNKITMSEGHTGLVQDIGDSSVFTSRNNRFVNNEYILNGSDRRFEWNNGERSFAFVHPDIGNDAGAKPDIKPVDNKPVGVHSRYADISHMTK